MLNSLTGMPAREIEISKARSLQEIKVNEISLVNKAANRRKFIFFKSDSGDGPVINLLDTIESIEDQYELTAGESEHIEKAIKTLSLLESEDVESLSKVMLLLSQLIEPNQKEVVTKSDKLWPSFQLSQRNLQKQNTFNSHSDNDDNDEEDNKWPSIS